MKILVIGASGLLAKPVIKHFDQNGFELRLFSRSVNESMFPGKNYEFFQGNIFNRNDLEKALKGCDAVHISIGRLKEGEAVKTVLSVVNRDAVKLISYVSGASVKAENTWFPMVKEKFEAEQALINSGIPYVIFRPTWFMESLPLLVRNGKAGIIGKQFNPMSIIAADDFARMLVNAYKTKEAQSKVYYIYGPEKFTLKESLEIYCNAIHPEIKKVSVIPTGMLKFIGFVTRNKELREVASMFKYFETTKEVGSPDEANHILGKPEITLTNWIKSLKS